MEEILTSFLSQSNQ